MRLRHWLLLVAAATVSSLAAAGSCGGLDRRAVLGDDRGCERRRALGHGGG